VIAADGRKQHGLILDLSVVDELHAHRHDDLYIASRTAMQTRPGARMVTISTGGALIDTPLGQLRERMKLPRVSRDGALTRAEGENLAILEWPLPADADLDDQEAVRPPTPRAGSPWRGWPSGADAVPRAPLCPLPRQRLDRRRGPVDCAR
jgi:phage terminase large subunit-like protein